MGAVPGDGERLMGTGPGSRVSGLGVWNLEPLAVPGSLFMQHECHLARWLIFSTGPWDIARLGLAQSLHSKDIPGSTL